MSRVLRGTAPTIQVVFYGDEAPVDSTVGVTVHVTRDDGSDVLAAGTVATHGTVGQYSVALTAAQTAQLDRLTATWSATINGAAITKTTTVDVAGGFFFELAEGRASDVSLADTSKYPTTALLAARDIVEDRCESITNVAWVRRYAKTIVSGDGSNSLALPSYMVRALRSIVDLTTGVAWTSPQLAGVRLTDAGVLFSGPTAPSFPFGDRNLAVAYEHGYDAPTFDLRRASLTHFRSVLFASLSGIPERATSYVPAAGGGTFAISTAGRSNTPTGIPDVDSVYLEHDHFIS